MMGGSGADAQVVLVLEGI